MLFTKSIIRLQVTWDLYGSPNKGRSCAKHLSEALNSDKPYYYVSVSQKNNRSETKGIQNNNA